MPEWSLRRPLDQSNESDSPSGVLGDMPWLMLLRAPSSAHPTGFIELCLPTLARTVPEGDQPRKGDTASR
jgi:hypothetical protein